VTEPPRPGLVERILQLDELADVAVPLSLRAAGDLGSADLRAAGPLALGELAARTGCDARSLGRVLRALAGRGVFREIETDRFALTPLAEPLRSDHPLSVAGAHPLLPADVRAWARLDHTVRTGRSAFTRHAGQSYRDYLAEHPVERARFRAALEARDRLLLARLLPALDWGGLGTIADVGGGSGTFLAGLLAHHRQLRGILFDLPDAVAGAPPVLEGAGVAGRCRVIAGSFFDAVPAGADTYLLRTVLRDWEDSRASALLGRVREAVAPGGRLLVLEALPAPGHPGALLDLWSLVMVEGPERGAADLERLLAGAGFELTGVVDAGPLSVLDARPA
jgi:SAM-dependent methyltransferase